MQLHGVYLFLLNLSHSSAIFPVVIDVPAPLTPNILFLNSMSESKIQPLAALVRCRPQVFLLLLGRKGIPASLLLLVSPYVKPFHEEDIDNIVGNNSDKNLIASSIIRRVIRKIDLWKVMFSGKNRERDVLRGDGPNSHLTRLYCSLAHTYYRKHFPPCVCGLFRHFWK
jgi:hypothetical protein